MGFQPRTFLIALFVRHKIFILKSDGMFIGKTFFEADKVLKVIMVYDTIVAKVKVKSGTKYYFTTIFFLNRNKYKK